MFYAVLRIVLLVYLGFGAFLFFSQRQLMYFPVAEQHSNVIKHKMFESAGEQIKVWTVNPGKDKAVIYFGGNAEDVFYNAYDLEKALPEHSIYLVNYRGYGGSSGQPSESHLFADALTIFDTLSSQHKQISVIGRSLGSSIAIYLASKRTINRLVLATPYDSAIALAFELFPVYPVKLMLRDKYENTLYAPQVKSSTLVLIAEQDNVVPMKHSISLMRYFSQQRVTQIIIPKAGHNDISGYLQYWKEITDFIR